MVMKSYFIDKAKWFNVQVIKLWFTILLFSEGK